MEKIDPYKHKERYLEWKKNLPNKIEGISKFNSDLLKQYILDMETGLNVASSSKKGSRSYIRLNVLRGRVFRLMQLFEARFNIDKITDLTETHAHSLFMDMRNGTIKRTDGHNFTAVRNFVKDFKALWHWWIKVNRKNGITIQDVTCDLDTTEEKPKWVYLTEDEVKTVCENAKYDYKVLIMFLFDSGIRAPTELMNVRVSDFYNNFKELNIREEISKGKIAGRKIKLLLCSQMLNEYVKKKGLSGEDTLFKTTPRSVNQYLKRLAKRVLEDKTSPAGEKYSNLTMYDFRHCSCCYWLPRYKSESALKYRFGWKKSEKIYYYSELLGMKDTISEEDLLVDLTKTEIEKQLHRSEKEKEIMQEKLSNVEKDLQIVMKRLQTLEKVSGNDNLT